MSATVFALMAVVMHNLPGVRDECGRAGARPSRAGQRARRPLSQYAAAQERGPPHGEPPSWQRETQMNGRAARRSRVATFRRSASNTCPASVQPIRRPHAIIFRPFRSSPKSSTMHFMHTSSLLMYSPLSSLRAGRYRRDADRDLYAAHGHRRVEPSGHGVPPQSVLRRHTW